MTMRAWQTPLILILSGSVIVMLAFGIRVNFGLYMDPISSDLGWGRGVFSFAIALQSIIWGVTTPLVGYIADRYGPARVLAGGGICYTAGLLVMSQAAAPLEATMGIGVLTGFAMSMTGFPIVLSVIGRQVDPSKRSFYLGVVSAAGSSGQVILVPFGQWMLSNTSHWSVSMMVLALMTAVIVPLSYALSGGNTRARDDYSNQTIGEAIREAGGHRGFKLLVAGYFVCGAQTMFIGAHLPAYLSDLGQPAYMGALALALIGGFNIAGCIMWGMLGNRFSKKKLLSLLYFLRAMAMLVFIATPITPLTVIFFTSTMGLLWLGTVPLTTGLVAQMFGTKFMSTLVGFTFVSHQIGSFLGIYLGGVVYDSIGNYNPIFYGGIFLGVAAAFVHFPINESPVPRLAQEAEAAQPAQ
ncbi:MAG: MFS transporter [Rhodospirillaceae bacterium]|nr:MFS transporter [Rhodospirillaceae bacterium]MBT3887494.1 MFS transporter [Rhodospirillaceae bacterium]MBT4118318.1 MFS transporter [Rhodospirillaceae bacterium]MBT4674566.1 MFS transporter [Rhodospirillaceae bacterium]MBT4720802.1 MFS transporter [Rhodospirillaceae bacterium]